MTANVAALHLVQTLMADKRPATAEDQKILAAWSSWGAQGLSQMFDESRDEYAARRDELHELLTPAELALTPLRGHLVREDVHHGTHTSGVYS